MDDQDPKSKKEANAKAANQTMWIAVGIALGVSIGLCTQHLAVGIAAGVAIGAGLAALQTGKSK